MPTISTNLLRSVYLEALTFSNPLTDTISTDQFSSHYD